MGQRLVLKVNENGHQIAAIYFHWSAYYSSALIEMKMILDGLSNDKYKNITDTRLKLIRICEDNGGCIDGGEGSKEFMAIQEMFPTEKFKADGSRNQGLIALTRDGMDDIEGWAEGLAFIDLDSDLCSNNCLYDYDSISDFQNDFFCDEGEPTPEFIEINYNPRVFNIDEIDYMIDRCKRISYYVKYNGIYYTLIA